MMAESSTSDILTQYRLISNKLKKRFLRKPNVQEARDHYAVLATQCETQDLSQYAGLCWQAVAKCECELGNCNAEIFALVRGGRQFLHAERKGAVIGCHSAGAENLLAALSCFSRATLRANHLGPLGLPTSTGLALELGHVLNNELDQPEAACVHFKNAADLQRPNPLTHLYCLGLVASSKVEQGDFDSALTVFNEMSCSAELGPDTPLGAFRDILHRCEVSEVLLLLLLQPTPQRLPPKLAHLLEKYTWGDYNYGTGELVSEELFLLLQSLVMASQSEDMASLCALEADLWKHLSGEQKTLLRSLVSSVGRSTHL